MVKFGKYEHLKQMQTEGLVYCNTLKYFTEIEDNYVRGDKHESAFNFETFNDTELLLKPASEPDSSYKKLNVKWGQMVQKNSNPLGNLFCLYCVDMTDVKEGGQIFVDERISDFGNHALVLLDTVKFEERLYNELQKRKFKYHFGHIDYIDLRSHNGKKTLFQKDTKYKFQNEFRIFIESNSQDPLKIVIGDISDITKLVDFDTFRKLKFKLP